MDLNMVGATLAFLLFIVNGSRRRRRRNAELEIRPPAGGQLLRPAGHHGQEGQPNSLSKSLWVPIQTQVMVSPLRSPTARYCSLMRTDQMRS
jgi:hypothetical protein